MASEDQMAYDAGFQSVAAWKRHRAKLDKAAEIEASRVGTPGFQPRSTSRFNSGESGVSITKQKAWEEQQRANAPVSEKIIPVQAPTPVPVRIDERLARESYQAYFDTARNGTERGRALHGFGISQGICRSTAFGFETNAEVNATIAAIQSGAASLKYGFDKTGAIASRAAASRVVSNQQKLKS